MASVVAAIVVLSQTSTLDIAEKGYRSEGVFHRRICDPCAKLAQCFGQFAIAVPTFLGYLR